MRGPSGSGKSTLAKTLKEKHTKDGYVAGTISTDHFFYEGWPKRPIDECSYKFDATKLSHYHKMTFADFCRLAGTYFETNSITTDTSVCVILDNTNIKWWEFKDYCLVAKKLGFEIEQAIPDGEWIPLELFGRNKHGVPLETIRKMISNFDSKEEIEEKISKL